MAERIGAGVWSLQGETVTLPVTITDARITASVFTSPATAARKLLAGLPLEPFTAFGRAFGLLMCIHYGEWALKTYDEVGVGLLALGPGRRPGLFLLDLPVTGAFTREAGQDFWALPKWLMTSTLRFGEEETDVTVSDGDTPVLSASFTHGRLRLPFGIRSALPAWSYLDHGAQAGRLLRGRVPMRLSGVRLGRGSFSVRLGEHPMAQRMEALGMVNRPLLTVHASSLRGPLGEWRAV
ncbi:acetoacetate decarboxylase family protein [Paractinoplanes atraurantiacus]|uniref:Acetoacetate decarboxylase (ADC) n=1 Tax=Paractinoplanes atraurantiacus TaxID=1036182 RepID=A0A285ID17_9ACTN|nr:acetoacetate decarboxylase family protein [Actinoplanes atraurantiacus]SNY45878.1 Acetoacetate decarboxylase (ADC) [Actinoplanes atraurantiacus]